MVDGGLSFEDLEVLHAAMLSEKSWPCRAPTDRDLHRLASMVGLSELYAASQNGLGVYEKELDELFGHDTAKKELEDYAKELGKLVGPSPDRQDAVAYTCFVIDSLSALEK